MIFCKSYFAVAGLIFASSEIILAQPNTTELATPAPQSAAPAKLPRPIFRPGRLVQEYFPPYPLEARKLGEEGKVHVRGTRKIDGSMVDISVKKSSGSASLDRAAVEAFKQWKFTPSTRDGVPIETSFAADFDFESDVMPIKRIEPPYPDDVRKRGEHGIVRFKGYVRPDGVLSDIMLVESSRSETLDRLSRDAFKSWQFKPTKSESNPKYGRVNGVFSFVKDELAGPNGYKLKSCADFVVDTDWFLEVYPEKTLIDMSLYKDLSGIFFYLGIFDLQQKVHEKGEKPSFLDAYKSTLTQCRTTPEAKFLDVLRGFADTIIASGNK
jgi:TonB family protein